MDLSLSTTLLLTRTPGSWNLVQAVDGPRGMSQALSQGSEGLLPTTSCWPGAAAGAAGEDNDEGSIILQIPAITSAPAEWRTGEELAKP